MSSPVDTNNGLGPRPPRRGAARRAVWIWAWRLLAALMLCALLAPAQALAQSGLRLEVVKSDSGQIAWSAPVRSGEPFTLWFLHSYDRAFFAEHYKVVGPGRILLTHMTFKSNLNGEGFEYSDFHLRPDGVGELRNINEVRREVHFMMGSPDMANHTLIIDGNRIELAKFIKPGTLVSLVVSRGSRTAGK